ARPFLAHDVAATASAAARGVAADAVVAGPAHALAAHGAGGAVCLSAGAGAVPDVGARALAVRIRAARHERARPGGTREIAREAHAGARSVAADAVDAVVAHALARAHAVLPVGLVCGALAHHVAERRRVAVRVVVVAVQPDHAGPARAAAAVGVGLGVVLHL